MNKNHKLSLYIIAATIDFYLILFLNNYKRILNKWDKLFILFIFISHFIFYIALWNENRKLLDISHFNMALSTLFAFAPINKSLLILVFIFLLGLNIEWICLNICILNSDEQNSNNNDLSKKIIWILTLLYTCFIAYKIGK